MKYSVTDFINGLNIESMSSILFIKINGPPISKFDPDRYVKIWLRTHNNAERVQNVWRDAVSNKKTKKKCW